MYVGKLDISLCFFFFFFNLATLKVLCFSLFLSKTELFSDDTVTIHELSAVLHTSLLSDHEPLSPLNRPPDFETKLFTLSNALQTGFASQTALLHLCQYQIWAGTQCQICTSACQFLHAHNRSYWNPASKLYNRRLVQTSLVSGLNPVYVYCLVQSHAMFSIGSWQIGAPGRGEGSENFLEKTLIYKVVIWELLRCHIHRIQTSEI